MTDNGKQIWGDEKRFAPSNKEKLMRNLFKRIILRLIMSRDGIVLEKLITWWYKRYDKNFSLKINLDSILMKDSSLADGIYISEKSRISLYRPYISRRIEILQASYLLQNIEFRRGDVILDCGANIGELGMSLKNIIKATDYHCFEPNPKDFSCCRLNHPNSRVINKGLWESSGRLKFFIRGETADSSLIEFGNYDQVIHVPVITLDQYAEEFSLTKIRLLKIEAEGAEPEILKGASKTIEKCDFVVVDAGPERGFRQENTVVPTFNFLTERNFTLKEFNHSRSIALFERNN